MNSNMCSELFDKAKVYAIKGEYDKTLRVFEELYNEFIADDFKPALRNYFETNDILTKFDEWEEHFKKWGHYGFYFCIGAEIYKYRI